MCLSLFWGDLYKVRLEVSFKSSGHLRCEGFWLKPVIVKNRIRDRLIHRMHQRRPNEARTSHLPAPLKHPGAKKHTWKAFQDGTARVRRQGREASQRYRAE